MLVLYVTVTFNIQHYKFHINEVNQFVFGLLITSICGEMSEIGFDQSNTRTHLHQLTELYLEM